MSIWDAAAEKIFHHVNRRLTLSAGGSYVNGANGAEGTYVRQPMRKAPSEFVDRLTHVIIDRFRIVVKGRMDASSQEYCGIVWTEEFFLEALVSLSEFNKSLLAYEKDGATVMLPPEQTPPEVALGCTILGVPAASIPADYRFVNNSKFRRSTFQR